MKQILFLLLCLFPACAAFSQLNLERFHKERMAINRKGMMVLGSWAAANIITGAAGAASSEGEARYFHRMNAWFGSVNLALSGIALLRLNRKTNPASFAAVMKEQSDVEKVFLFNAGFDVAYLAGGLYLIEKGNSNRNPGKYKGYGKSLLMQGGALLLFDGILYLLHNKHGKELDKVLDAIQVSGNTAGIRINL